MKIFISYRRIDSKIFTGRILDRLTQAFGRRSIFRDIEDITAGKDFRKVLNDAVNEADIMLVMIGPQWASITDANGNKRLFDPQDFVRFEVEKGLKRKDMTVIPVLLLNTAMPPAEDLPNELRELSYRNAVVIRDDPDFNTDLQRIISQIRRLRPIESTLRLATYVLPILLLLLLGMFAIQRLAFNNQTSNQGINPPGSVTPSNSVGPSQTKPVNVIKDGIAQRAFQIYEQPNTDSLPLARSKEGDQISVLEANSDGTWYKLRLPDGSEGWGLAANIQILDSIKVGAGYGVRGDFWEVYFTAPLDNPNPQSHLGIDARFAAAIDSAKTSIDTAMFEVNNEVLVEALVQAAENGVEIRVVTDDEMGMEASQEPGYEHSFPDLIRAGIPVRVDSRSGLMHDKFIIIDGKTVWTGSYNLTDTGNYGQNNNALVIHSTEIASAYEDEFNEMFEQGQFGPKSPPSKTNELKVDSVDVEIYFLPDDDPFPRILELMKEAKKSIRFMAFVFTDREIADEMIAASKRGVTIQGIIEKVGSNFGQMVPLHCAGLDIRLDGNPQFLHHKVIVIDDKIVITGSANFSQSAAENNDENMVIVHDSTLASAYKLEFDRMLSYATVPSGVTCSQ